MRHLAAATIGLCLLCGAAQASDAQVWQGTVFISSITAACTSANVAAVGDYYTLVYRPIITGSAANTGNEGLTFVGTRNAMHYSTPLNSSQSFRAAGTANIVTVSSHAGSASGTGDYALKFTPASPTLTSPQIMISGKLKDFWVISGCVVGITASLDLRID